MKSNYDVIVSGGGLSGVAAAISAAREGFDVLIIERYGFLGGMATAGLVNPFMPYTIRPNEIDLDMSRPVNTGIFADILKNLDELGGLHENKHTFNEEILKLILDRMVAKAGVKVLFHSFICEAETAENSVKSVTVVNKSGITKYTASYFIDATGDADISALAGCNFNQGRDSDQLCQPMTLCFRLCDIDWQKYNKISRNIYDRDYINKKYKEKKESGLLKNPREDVLMFEHMSQSIMYFNSTRVLNKYATNTEDLSAAESEGREQVYELFRFMKENIPGFENCQMLMTAPQIGVRESRRIVGEYELTEADICSALKFPDSIARGTYPMDIHSPSPTGEGGLLKATPFGDFYTIPESEAESSMNDKFCSLASSISKSIVFVA